MSTDDLGLTGDPEPLAASFARAKAELGTGAHHDHAPTESVRESTYCGRHIVVRTTYEITVDGKRIEGHLGVTNGGQVHYHPLPNLGFASAIELVEALIDTFPDDFDSPADPDTQTEPDDHSPGDGPHDHEPGPDPHDHEPGHEPHDHEPAPEPHDHEPGAEPHDHADHGDH